jgi:hypothetical protein
MLKGLLGSVAALAAGAGLAMAQPPRAVLPPAADPPPVAGSPPIGLVPAPLPPGNLPPGSLPPGYSADPNAVAPPGFDGPGLFGGGAPSTSGFYLERVWSNFDYLLWKPRNGPSAWPQAVQGTLLNGVNPFLPGALTLFGGADNIIWDFANGARFTFGGWLPGSTKVGVEASLFMTEVKPLTRAQDSGPNGIPVLGTPFINELTGNIDSLFAAGFANPGRIYASEKTQTWSAEVNLVGNVYRALYFSANVSAGFRTAALEEEQTLQFNSIGNPNGFFLGVPNAGPIAMEDRFTTRNFFYGGELGFAMQYRWRALTFDYDNRIAMGVMHRILDVNGITRAGGATAPGGLFAQTTNIGQRTDNDFGAIPQLHGQIGWQVMQCLNVHVGYDFMYISSVIRPGDQIDPVVNPTLVPLRPEFGAALGTARPAQRFVTTDYWIQGWSFGFTLRY